MLKLLNKLEDTAANHIKTGIVLLGVLIAAQVQYIQHGWINPDSVLYFEAARLFANGEWKAGFDIFPWPFYSLWIATLHKLTGFGVHLSAQILNVLFFGVATHAFLNIIQLAGGKQRELISAALVWLSAPYMVGDVLEMLMRDEGFWAFYLSALVFFIRFHQHHKFTDALFWQLCIILATLFRIEGILFLMLLPAALLLAHSEPARDRIRHFLIAHSINLALTLALIIIVASGMLPKTSLGRLNEVFTQDIFHQFTALFRERSQIMSDQVLGNYLEEFATAGILLTFIYAIVAKIISATGLVHVALATAGIKHRKSLMNPQVARVLLIIAAIAVANMALIISKVFVLSGRYVLSLSFILMFFASFYLAFLFKYLQNSTSDERKLRWVTIALIIFMSLSLIKNILPKEKSYNYMQDAVSWLIDHNPRQLPVFYSDPRMRYYANADYIGRWDDNWEHVTTAIKDNSIRRYQFLVIDHKKEDTKNETYLNMSLPEYKEVYRSSNRKGKKSVAVYSRSSP